MESSMRRPKFHKAYGRTKANAPCKRHPKHIQSPGVCSRCLNEKLFRLANGRAKRPAIYSASSLSSSSSSYISSLSSSDESSYSSPVLSYAPSRILKKETLKKSRSTSQGWREEEDRSVGILKRGFWSSPREGDDGRGPLLENLEGCR
ncbi:uncharacterized protein LOC125209626 [Salvia hispanica]|uniref:uncharacterized protein LOC125209626 n=1 Tax=Salvia hispanica TaxID=49212 RepID=UPI002009A34C|nr:uncharacterized protein LOC125209626 [Salvia hispanica]